MAYEWVSTETHPYAAVRFHDAGRERWLIVRSSGNAPAVVAEALGQSTAVLIAESMNDGVVLENERPRYEPPTQVNLPGEVRFHIPADRTGRAPTASEIYGNAAAGS